MELHLRGGQGSAPWIPRRLRGGCAVLRPAHSIALGFRRSCRKPALFSPKSLCPLGVDIQERKGDNERALKINNYQHYSQRPKGGDSLDVHHRVKGRSERGPSVRWDVIGLKKEGTPVTRYSMGGGALKHHAQRNQPGSEGQALRDSTL